MPRLNDTNMDQHTTTGTGSFGFSATKLDNLGASEYTLATICVDVSGSVESFKAELEGCLKEAVKACQFSPRADNLMIRVLAFSKDLQEIHGFKLLSEINVDDYNNCLQLGGMTALFDATQNAVDATVSYAKTLSKNDFDANAITIVITDGMDNNSTATANMCAASLKGAVGTEALESIVSILVGVNTKDQLVSQFLSDFNSTAKFQQYIEIDQANAKSLAKLGDFVSKSISATSLALGTGGPSKSLSF